MREEMGWRELEAKEEAEEGLRGVGLGLWQGRGRRWGQRLVGRGQRGLVLGLWSGLGVGLPLRRGLPGAGMDGIGAEGGAALDQVGQAAAVVAGLGEASRGLGLGRGLGLEGGGGRRGCGGAGGGG